ncbi:hypothetical protein EMIHUDRAFT_219597 [Emiliania huxleyi CCMP1516]|uniref:Uncharacterized protein n=2 Tax=Emiliania huxleyi TaxID=2903 RepID=A0A0D3I3S2_EMIH1|nr:hypothetical protein EMIHUDRAFT_219597 [Emiliania huxleyi CCMP1516]EOD05907.1 hypothetical protein EMIHUDRAFT_219597 [Emiliania huxleyi CCMP1516]|eukprot:XP_005758336.1 hypothetical protein EMIHUDRAFT_219597 [Emiliania huxleyi CCMP1516]
MCSEKKINRLEKTKARLGVRRENPKKPSKKPQKASEPPVTRLLAKRSMMRGQRGSRPAPTLPEQIRDLDRRTAALRASIRAADDVLETDLQSDEILACFEEALGERQPEMGTDAAAGREANAEKSVAAGARKKKFITKLPRTTLGTGLARKKTFTTKLPRTEKEN